MTKGYKKEARPGVWKCMIWLPAEPGLKAKQKGWTVYGTEKDADDSIEDKRVDARRGNLQRPNRELTLAAYLRSWVQGRQRNMKSRAAAERYEGLVRVHIEPSPLGNRPLTKISKADLELFLDGLTRPGSNKLAHDGRPLSSQTRRHIGRLLRQALGDAVLEGKLRASPAITLAIPSAENEEGRALEGWEASRLLQLAQSTRVYPVLLLAFATGARRGELLALRWSDLKGPRLTIQRALDVSKDGLREKETKTGVKRALVLTEETMQFLAQHKAAQSAHRLTIPRDVWVDKGLIVCNEIGDWMSPDLISKDVSRLMQKAGLLDASLHSCRHTFASQALTRGVRMDLVSRMLGHTNLQTTVKRYGHLMDGELEVAARQIGDFLRTATGGSVSG